MARKQFLFLSLLVVLASDSLAWGQPRKPVTVSPGSSDGLSVVAHSCPTFSWGAVEGAASYEVVVYELSEEALPHGEEASPVIRKSLPGTVLSWTPSLAQCLQPGREYEWYIRAEEEFEGGVWSERRLFEVEERPSFREVRSALRVLKRYLEERGEEDVLPDLEWLDRGESSEEQAPGVVDWLRRDLPPLSVAVEAGVPKVADPLPVADWGGTSAIVAELPATTGETHGVVGVTNSTTVNSSGVHGEANATSGGTRGVYGQSESTIGTGVYGYASATSGGTHGVYGLSISTDGTGVQGLANAASGQTIGVDGQSTSPDYGTGVQGLASAATGNTRGVWGGSFSTSGTGVYGYSNAATGYTYGVYGTTSSTSGTGVSGWASAATGSTRGVYGRSDSTIGFGVTGYASGTTGYNKGVYGQSDSTTGTGVTGNATALTGITYGVYGEVDSPSGYAGYFDGNVNVNGTLTKTAGSFKIDHPLEPAKKYLYHSFVESPDMMNIYNGNASLDEQGEARVELPAWFEAVNRDFRYQLTTVGSFAPVYIAEKIRDNRFKIAGGESGMVVSWQVTGIRRDAWAEAHPISVEEDKPEKEVGTYLHPEELGFDKTLGLDYQRNTAMQKPHDAKVGSPEEKR